MTQFSKAYLKRLAKLEKTVSLSGVSFSFEKPGFTDEDIKSIRELELKTPDDVTSLTDLILELQHATLKSGSRSEWLRLVGELEEELNDKAEAFFRAGNAKLYLERQFEVN